MGQVVESICNKACVQSQRMPPSFENYLQIPLKYDGLWKEYREAIILETDCLKVSVSSFSNRAWACSKNNFSSSEIILCGTKFLRRSYKELRLSIYS